MALAQPFERLAIVNRGEPAMRLIHAVRELNALRDRPIRTIALCTEPDLGAMFVREADEAHCIGPATAVARRRPPRQRLPRLRRARARAGDHPS